MVKKFIKWIKILNSKIKGTVIQCGNLSKFFDIKRGCRQGDPISPYLFILCAEILTLLIQNNKSVIGIDINGYEVKISQFADDTTIFLDGSQLSLQTALNTIETFGTISGLLMNTSKTKIIWLGRNRFLKDKLNISVKLDWDNQEFNVLGITFDADLKQIIELNYDKVLADIQKLLGCWEKRQITPIGKISIIKTLCLSKLNHLFSCLPTPSQTYIHSIEKLFYSFIWNGKPDKIKRSTIVKPYKMGGLKMINLPAFIEALNCTWIRRLLKGGESPWLKVFEKTISSPNNFYKMGIGWYKKLITCQSNKFWKSLLNSWVHLLDKVKPETNNDIMSSVLWFNTDVQDNDLYLADWDRIGIRFIADIIDKQGRPLDFHELKKYYAIPHGSMYNYFRLRGQVKKYIKVNKNDELFNKKYPIYPFHIKILFKHQRGAKDMYRVLNKSDGDDRKLRTKWHLELSTELSKDNWDTAYSICHHTVKDNEIIWLQYRVLNRMLGTNKLRFAKKLTDNNKCRLCQSHE